MSTSIIPKDSDIKQSERNLRLALSAAGIGLWEFDVNTQQLRLDLRCRELSGNSLQHQTTFADFLSHIHPEDRASVSSAFNDSIKYGGPGQLDVEYRVIGLDGQPLWVHATGRTTLDSSGSHRRLVGSLQDVHSRRCAEDALRESERKLRLAMEASAIGMWDWDLRTDTVVWSSECYAIHGLKDDDDFDGTGAAFDKLLHPHDKERVWKTVRDAAERNVRYECEFRIVRPNGDIRWVANVGRSIRDGSNKAIRVIGTIVDITERRTQQKALMQSEAELRAIYDGGATHLALLTPSGVLLRANRASLQFANVKLESVLNIPFWETIWFKNTPGAPETVRSAVENAAKGTAYRNQVSILTPAGDSRAFDFYLHPVHDENASVIAIVAEGRDISESQMSEQALRESEFRLDLALDSGQMGLWEWNIQTNQSVWNRKEYEILGLEVRDCKENASRFLNLIHPDDQKRFGQSLDAVMKKGKDWRDECRIIRPDGEIRWIAAVGRLFRDEVGTPTKMIGVNYDITAQKEAEGSLREAHVLLSEEAKHLEKLVEQRTGKLQEAMNELEAFSYSVAHDLRAPLRAMRGYAQELLTESQISEAGKTYAQRIDRAAGRLDTLTREILSYSKLSRGEIEAAPCDLDAIAREVIEQYPRLSEHSCRIQIESPLAAVAGNHSLLTQILSNLLTNACKFVSPGTIPHVRVFTVEESDAIRLVVADNGIGISPEHDDRLFRIFGRIHPESAYEGTGMGLAIVKKAAEKMGGSAGYTSEPGKGSRFWVKLNRPGVTKSAGSMQSR